MSQSRRPSSISSDFKKRYGSVKDSYAAAAIAAFAREIDIDPFAGACATPTKELISWESASPGTLESHALLISQSEACSSGASLSRRPVSASFMQRRGTRSTRWNRTTFHA